MRGILEHLHVFFERAGVCGELPVTSMIFFTLLHSITVWLPTRVICCFNFVKANGSGPSWRIWSALTRFRMTVGWLGENQLTSYDLALPCPRDSVRLTVGNVPCQNMNQSCYPSYTVAVEYRLCLGESLRPSCPRSTIAEFLAPSESESKPTILTTVDPHDAAGNCFGIQLFYTPLARPQS